MARRQEMDLLEEWEIRAHHLRQEGCVCPVCSSDEDKINGKPVKIVAEDVIHDEGLSTSVPYVQTR
jgi:hypothetical protein